MEKNAEPFDRIHLQSQHERFRYSSIFIIIIRQQDEQYLIIPVLIEGESSTESEDTPLWFAIGLTDASMPYAIEQIEFISFDLIIIKIPYGNSFMLYGADRIGIKRIRYCSASEFVQWYAKGEAYGDIEHIKESLVLML